MVKKSRRQREGTERVRPNPYNVVGHDIDGENTDSVETTVPRGESSSTMFQPETSNKGRGILRLKRKTSQFKSSQPAAMHAVANGERMEAFSSANKNGAADRESTTGSESDLRIVETTGGAEKVTQPSNKPAYSKPCPKSKKATKDTVKDADDSLEEAAKRSTDSLEDAAKRSKDGLEDAAKLETEEQPQAAENAPEPTPDIPEPTLDIPEQIPDVPETETEVLEEEETGQVEGEEANSSNATLEDECTVRASSEEPIDGQAGFEGVVTEPEDRESPANVLSDPDVSISFLDSEGEHSELDKGYEEDEDEVTTDDLQGPLIEFPRDSPGKTSKAQLDDEEIEDGNETDVATNENHSDPEEEDDLVLDPPETGSKILHRLGNPAPYGDAQTMDEDSEYEGGAKGRTCDDLSFGRSLRSLAGRRTLKTRDSSEPEDSVASTTGSSYPGFFNFGGFGKRKAEGDTLVECEPKRAKPEQGVDSLGFFARLTSPVVNRLRGMRVGAPKQPHAGQEVVGHEERAVALPAPPPASKRCVVM